MQLLIRRLNFHFKEWVYRNAEGKKVFLLVVITNLIYGYMLLVSIPKVMSYAGGIKIPDMMPAGYEPNYIFALLEKLGEKGRDAYLFGQIPIDLFYPFFFGITYCLLTAYLLKKLQNLKAEPFYLCLLPIMGACFDYLENAGIILMLVSYPHVSVTVIQVTAFFTVFKSLLSSISFTIIVILLFVLIYRKISKFKR